MRYEKHWLLALVTVSFEFLCFFLMTALFRDLRAPTPARVMTILLLRELNWLQGSWWCHWVFALQWVSR